jgi:hypothetical protein
MCDHGAEKCGEFAGDAEQLVEVIGEENVLFRMILKTDDS